MKTISILNSASATLYENYTFPAFRSALRFIDTSQSILAIAASVENEPAGLLLADLHFDTNTAELLSVYVTPSHRCQGIATALVIRLEQELLLKGFEKVEVSYVTGKTTTPALESIFAKCDWSIPETRMFLCKGEAAKVMEAPWIEKYGHLPSSYSIFPWAEITTEERHAIQQQQEVDPWIPEHLIPFNHEKNMEPLISMGLRYQGEVVGWLICHRMGFDTIRHTCSFVRKDLQKRARIIPLYTEACKRQLEANIPYGIWGVYNYDKPMLEFVKNRWQPYLISITETKGSFKVLN